MNKAELFEEIRTLLREAQQNTVDYPWVYSDEDLIYQVRSALRRLRSMGVSTDTEMSTDGELSPEPSETEGLLIAYLVANRLIMGDLIRKLQQGELGIYFRSGPDIIDTKSVTGAFTRVAEHYENEYMVLLTSVLSSQINPLGSVFGTPTLTDGG